MPRHIKFGIAFLLLLSILGVSYYYNLQRRVRELMQRPQEAREPYLAARPVFAETAPRRSVRLFFPSSQRDGLLEPEEREIHSSERPAVEAKQIVAELIAGSKAGRLPALPATTQLRELFVTADGLAVVDVTKEASGSHPGGLTYEVASIYAVVNSLTQNVQGIDRVQILIEGMEAETLAGHIDMSRPFREDLTLISSRSDRGEEKSMGNTASHRRGDGQSPI